MTRLPVRFPSRLVEKDSPVGRLLREGLDQPVPGPSEFSSWQKLHTRRTEPSRVSAGWVLAASLAGFGGLFFLLWQSHQRAEVSVTAEVVPLSAAASRNVPAPARSADRAAPKLERPLERTNSAKVLAPAPAESARPSEANDTAACARLAREGDYQQAVACYDQIARGQSMSAELALYEKARLESRVLGDQSVALGTLEEHRRRFPSGVLGTEAGLTRIELLVRLGRATEALEAISTAMDGRLGKERGGDLHAMRGDLLVEQGDCPGALREYEQARQGGVHPSRLAKGTARCQDGGSQSSP